MFKRRGLVNVAAFNMCGIVNEAEPTGACKLVPRYARGGRGLCHVLLDLVKRREDVQRELFRDAMLD